MTQAPDLIEKAMRLGISECEAELDEKKAELAQYLRTKKKYLPKVAERVAADPFDFVPDEPPPNGNGHRNGGFFAEGELPAPSPVTFSGGRFNLSATINRLIGSYPTNRIFDKNQVVEEIRRSNAELIKDSQIQTVASHIWKLAKNNFLETVELGSARVPSKYRRIQPINLPSKKSGAKTVTSVSNHTG